MKSIQRILKATRMSREMLADFLLVRRQSLMDTATGRRSLGKKSLQKLNRMEFYIEKAFTNNAIDAVDRIDRNQQADSPVEAGRSELNRLAYCRARAIILQKKLDKLGEKRSKCQLFLKVLELMEPETDFEEKWMEVRRYDIIKKLKSCSEANGRSLRKQLFLLQAEAGYISRLAEKQHEKDEIKPTINNNLKTTKMEYSVNTLTSTVACDEMLNVLKAKRKQLWKDKDFLKPLLDYATMMREQANAHLMNEWNELQDIEARVTLLPVMPEKKHLADHVNEQFNELAARGRSTLGTIKKAILRKQYELACIQRHLIENVRCVKAVKSRMMQMVG